MLGLGSIDPRHMSEDDAAKLMNYARKENPAALRQAVHEKALVYETAGQSHRDGSPYDGGREDAE